MRMYPREFPSGRRNKPKRRAERRVYEGLANIDRRGFCYYEWRRDYECPELDFAVWIEKMGRFALQVKGGRHLLVEGEWHLRTREAVQPIAASPLDKVWLEALDLHDDIAERACTPYSPHVIPVVSFPDMRSDEDIENLARRKGVYVVWGTENLLADLERIVRSRSVSDVLPMERIAAEVLAVTDGQIRLDATVEGEAARRPGRPAALALSVGGRKIIQVSTQEMHLRFGTGFDAGDQP